MRFLIVAAACVTSLVVGAEEVPLYKQIETPPAPVLSPEQATAAFRVAPGFSIQAVAVEPLVEDPVAMTWDEAGRLYVAEMRAYMQDTYGTNQTAPIGSVVRLTDVDGDGIYDQREVILDQLVLPRAVAIVNEGLLIAEPPNLWLCPSATGLSADIDCEQKRNLGSYGDQPGSVEHAENGLLQGLDNWLYSAKSNRRLKLKAGQLVVEPTLFRGQWGIAEDGEGRLYYNTNSNLLSGDNYSAQNVVAAGTGGADGLNTRVSKDDALYAVRVNTGVNRAYLPGVLREDGRLNQPTSASGMVVYEGDQFGAEHAQDVFVTEPAANAVARLVLTEDRLAVDAKHVRYPDPEWQQREFLASTDERFRPVNAYTGPDGALYVVDFYRGIIQDHVFISEQLREQVDERNLARPPGLGRIWRITAADKPATWTRLDNASSAELLDALDHSNGWVRRTAHRLLLAEDARSVTARLRTVLKQANAPEAVHALWILEDRGALTRKQVLAALDSDSPSLARQAAIAGAGLLRVNDVTSRLASAADERLRIELIAAMARFNDEPKVLRQVVDLLLAEWQDGPLRGAIVAAMRGQELAVVERLLASGWTESNEQQVGLLDCLAAQRVGLFAAQDGQLHSLLNMANNENVAAWARRGLLQGILKASRQDGFQRVMLASEHPLFEPTERNSDIWPAIARVRSAFTWPGDELAATSKPLTLTQRQNLQAGAEYYAARCATCHGSGGEGIANLAPPLVDSPWVTDHPEWLLRIVLHGVQGPIEVAGVEWNGVMPGHALISEFSDEVAEGLMNYLGRSWGHSGRAVTTDFVRGTRKETAGRSLPWTVAELQEVPINTHYRDYSGLYGGRGFPLKVRYDGNSKLLLDAGLFSGPLVDQGNERFMFEPRNMGFDFVRDDAGRVVGIVMLTPDSAGTTIPRVGDIDE